MPLSATDCLATRSLPHFKIQGEVGHCTMHHLKKLWIFLAFVMVLLPQQSRAQGQNKPAWQPMPGTATDISINADGQAYAVGTDGTPWRWDRTEQRWRRMSGNFVRISAALGNRPWAVNAEGIVFYYNGLWWEDKATDVVDVAADVNGNVFIAMANGQIKKWYSLRSEWQVVEGTAKRISIDDKGQPWVIAQDGKIQSFDGKAWMPLPGAARDIALGGASSTVIADMAGVIRRWNNTAKHWDVVNGVADVTAVAVTPDDKIWAVVEDGAIFANGTLQADEKTEEENSPGEPQAPVEQARPVIALTPTAPVPTVFAPVATNVEAKPVLPDTTPDQRTDKTGTSSASAPGYVDPVTVTTNDSITFVDTRQTAQSIAIGADGSVFGLDRGGNILRWSNRKNKFDSFPGALMRISVDAQGHPWGISALGRVFRHDGNQWRQIYNATASDLSVGFDGTVLASNAAGRLLKLNDAKTRFKPIPGTGVAYVATGPDGTAWTIRKDKLVQRCDVTPCKIYPQKANAISVGPDGSVYIVSNINRLMRLNKDGNFEIIQTPGHIPATVAVGPMGYPWLTAVSGNVLAATFFDRDETGDQIVAASTAENGTTGTGATGTVTDNSTSSFTFSKNIIFETVPAPGLSSGQYSILASDNDGIVWAAGYDAVEKYNPRTKQFVDANTRFETDHANINDFDIAPNGDIWADASVNQRRTLIRERNRVWKKYTVDGASVAGVAVSPDGTVFAIFDFGSGRYLYSKPANSEKFTKFSTNGDIFKVSVGPGNNVWIIDTNNNVKQWTGKKFSPRPARGQKANWIGVGKKDGTVYVSEIYNTLRKWNGINQSFDKVNNISAQYVAVDGDGRPWVSDGSDGTIKKAKN